MAASFNDKDSLLHKRCPFSLPKVKCATFNRDTVLANMKIISRRGAERREKMP